MNARKSLRCHEYNIGRAVNVKGHSGEVSEGNKEHVIGNSKKGHPCYKWQRTWLNCVLVFCGRQNLQIGYLTGELSKRSIEGMALFLLTAYSKMQRGRDEFKKELLSKKIPELKDLGNF